MPMTKVSLPLIDPAALTGLPMGNQGELVVHDEDGNNVALEAPGPGQILVGNPGAPKGMAWQEAASIPSAGGRLVGEITMAAFAAAPAQWLPCDGAAVDRTAYELLYLAIGDTFGAGDGSTTFNVPDLRGRSPMGQGAGFLRVEILGVNTVNDHLTLPVNDISRGTAVVYTSTGTPIGGLSSGGTYYYIPTTTPTSTDGKLATTKQNALIGIPAIDLTSAGTGVHSLQVVLSARALGEVGGEEAHTLSTSEIPAHTHSGGIATGGPGAFAGGSTAHAVDTSSVGSNAQHNNVHPVAVVGFFIYAGV